jgi:hypothetical protein
VRAAIPGMIWVLNPMIMTPAHEVRSHLMFGILALSVDQWMRLLC